MSQKPKRLNSVRLDKKFFEEGADRVAKNLLGKRLIRILPDGTRKEGIITETEAYVGTEDRASHSFGGRRTKRNEIMYGEAGRIYVYFTYGMHWLLNFVVSKKDDPQAVLIRGLDVVSGPARLTKYLEIGKDFYGEDLTKSNRIWVEDIGIKVGKSEIKSLPRVGINYAGGWKDKLLRFVYEEKSNFFERVYAEVKKIPEGKVMTYGQIANKLGTRDARRVGHALHANRDRSCPCHRVVNKEGRIAPSYAFGGFHEQRNRLIAEGVKFLDEMKVDLDKCGCRD